MATTFKLNQTKNYKIPLNPKLDTLYYGHQTKVLFWDWNFNLVRQILKIMLGTKHIDKLSCRLNSVNEIEEYTD